MYQKGDLQITDDPCKTMDDEGYCDDFHKHALIDSRTKDYDRYPDVAFLPHSCDEWVIGWVENIDALIADLQEARVKISARTGERIEEKEAK